MMTVERVVAEKRYDGKWCYFAVSPMGKEVVIRKASTRLYDTVHMFNVAAGIEKHGLPHFSFGKKPDSWLVKYYPVDKSFSIEVRS